MKRQVERYIKSIIGCSLVVSAACLSLAEGGGTAEARVAQGRNDAYTIRKAETQQFLQLSTEETSWNEIADKLGQAAVDARVDRVWGAIPGLHGWKLDVDESKRETALHRDGHVYLTWKSVAPRTRLSDLPPQPIYRGPKQERSATLMFNVSWGEEYLPQILNTLRKTKTKATFFLDGAWVKQNPELARRIADEGHDIGSHGQGHPDFKRLSNGQLERQTAKSAAAIKTATGRDVTLLAPPSGSFDARTVQIAARHHMYVILWTVDTVDWRRPPASQMLRRVNARMTPGALILMHPTAPTAKALPSLIQSLQGQGYTFKTVNQVTSEVSGQKPPSTLSGKP